jgi:hypothetical protein
MTYECDLEGGSEGGTAWLGGFDLPAPSDDGADDTAEGWPLARPGSPAGPGITAAWTIFNISPSGSHTSQGLHLGLSRQPNDLPFPSITANRAFLQQVALLAAYSRNGPAQLVSPLSPSESKLVWESGEWIRWGSRPGMRGSLRRITYERRPPRPPRPPC